MSAATCGVRYVRKPVPDIASLIRATLAANAGTHSTKHYAHDIRFRIPDALRCAVPLRRAGTHPRRDGCSFVARMERSAIRDASKCSRDEPPDCASLHPGLYGDMVVKRRD